jgi:DNA-binding transcriptional ArsR family regulator
MYSQIERRQLPAHFRALANPMRLRVLERLAEVGEQSVKDLATHLRMSQPRMSWHLAILLRGGAVRRRKEGRQVYCLLDLEAIQRNQLVFWELLHEKKRIGVRP